MAQYKVIQDIEAEDKLVAWLSLRQFIYAVITIVCGFFAVRLFMTSVWFFGFIFVPPALFFGLLSAPLGGAQSTEIWLLAKIRFFLKPRRRIWDQTGIQQLVSITAPKKEEKQLTKGYSNEEVKSRLKTLATTLDTRGWAIKNTTNMYQGGLNGNSDRLVDIAAVSGAPATDTEADMLDPEVNPRARSMNELIDKASVKYKDAVRRNIEKSKAEQHKTQAARPTLPPIAPNESNHLSDSRQLAYTQKTNSYIKAIQPLKHASQASDHKQSTQAVTPTHDPAILNIVKNSDDLSVQTIAGQAKRVKDQSSDDEVVINLH